MDNKIEIDIHNKYFCYLLGIIWADGHLEKNTNRVSISLIDLDIIDIEYIFHKVGKWNRDFCNNEKRNYKNQIRLSISDKYFYDFLSDNDFKEKSIKSPNKIISLMNLDNIKYFIRGVSDGDGCFYYNKKNFTRQFVVSSSYYQDWTYLSSIASDMGCKYEVRRVVNSKSKSSLFRICNISILKFGNFIYDDFFGLKRKYFKFLEIKESYLEEPYKYRKYNTKEITIDDIFFNSMNEASNYFNIDRNTLRRRLKNGTLRSNYII